MSYQKSLQKDGCAFFFQERRNWAFCHPEQVQFKQLQFDFCDFLNLIFLAKIYRKCRVFVKLLNLLDYGTFTPVSDNRWWYYYMYTTNTEDIISASSKAFQAGYDWFLTLSLTTWSSCPCFSKIEQSSNSWSPVREGFFLSLLYVTNRILMSGYNFDLMYSISG